ncbi:hypothetical protein BC835DRAFT_393895 [Cytidiella melzeri]|nr:hypothetical protein BC835DRAFT_393895 [Cytidiella melzeri]
MADSNSTKETSPSVPPQSEAIAEAVAPEASSAPQEVDRTQLLQTAQAFLNSPHVRSEGIVAKRNFLVQKGLNEAEIEQLLQTTPAHAPLVPPRTYPQPPQSNLPNLLIGLFRIATWIAGGSAAVLLAYFRFVYPRVAQSFQARHALRTHQKGLLSKLTTSIETTKTGQSTTFALLPSPKLSDEDPMYAEYESLEDILVSAKEPKNVPDVTMLRCAIWDIKTSKQPATTIAIFGLLKEKMAWPDTEETTEVQSCLWKTLSSSPLFSGTPPTSNDSDGAWSTTEWTYNPPAPHPTPPLVSSLSSLDAVLHSATTTPRVRYQNTLQSLTDLTGYIATQTYALPTGGIKYTATGITSALSPEEEELRREIRALKGLVLNRRSFMPTRPSISLTTPSS